MRADLLNVSLQVFAAVQQRVPGIHNLNNHVTEYVHGSGGMQKESVRCEAFATTDYSTGAGMMVEWFSNTSLK